MADSFIQLSPDSTGKRVDTRTAPDGDHREVQVIGSPSTADVAEADATFGLDVDVTRSVLPAGAATAANQLPNSHDVTVDNAAGAGAVNIQDGGNSITVDGTIAVSGAVDTELPAAAALADNTANPTAPAVGAFNELWDGATWDRAPGNSVDGALVNLGANNDVTDAAAEASLAVIDDWDESDRAKVNPIVGQAGVAAGAGAVGVTVQRVTLASDDPAVASLQTLDNAIAGSEMQVDVVGALPAGTNNIGDIDVLTLPSIPAGTNNIGDVDVLSVIPGTGATNEGKAVDSAAGATDTGIAALAVRDDALAALTPADGDYTHLRVDSTGALWTRPTSGGGGTSSTDEAAFTAGTTAGTPVMGARDDTASDTLAEDTVGIIRATTNRALHVNLRDASGNELAVGGGTQYDEDTVSSAADKITMAGVVRKDTAATLVDTDGDRTQLQVDAVGRLHVNGSGVTQPVSAASLPLPAGAATSANQTTEIASLAAIESDADAIRISSELIDDTIKVLGTDTYTEATTKGQVIGAVRRDADTSPVGTDNEIGPLTMDANGRLKVEAFSGEALPVTDNAGSLTVDGSVSITGAIPAGTNNIGDVDVLSLPAIPAGTNNIGDVDIASIAAGTSIEVVGDVAADAAVPANPVAVGGRASTAVPTAVSADGDSVFAWLNRNGLAITSAVPGLGLNADPYTLLSETAQYTTTQTSTVLVAGGASERIVVTSIQIQVGGTTAGTLQVYFGTGAYARGTDEAIFDGEFAPSATLKPGFFAAPPAGFRAGALGDDILVTDSAALNPLTITVWYYILGV